MKNLIFVAAGGIAGSLSRYLISETLPSYPIAIFIANLIGVSIAYFFGTVAASLFILYALAPKVVR